MPNSYLRAGASMPDERGWVGRHVLGLASALLGLVSVGLGIAYRFPALTRPAPRPGARVVSIVQYIDSLGPVWLIAFAAIGGLLWVSIWRGDRWLTIAHALASGVYGAFTCAAWLGWALSDPRPTTLAPVLAVGITGMHVLLSVIFADRRDLTAAAHRAAERARTAPT